jgi:hypothetical protein
MLRKISQFNVILAACLICLLTAGRASADVIINFNELPLDRGIHLTGFQFDGTPIDVTKLNGAESFHISSPAVPPGYHPDAILSHIGISQTSNGYLVDILDNPGGTISDQVYVHQFIPAFSVIDFISSPDQFFTGIPPFATVVETGNLQNVLNYVNDRGERVSINVLSPVPEPTSLALVGMGVFGLLVGRAIRRRLQQNAAV